MRERLRNGRGAVALAGVATVLVAIVLAVAWGGKERETVVSVPQPPPVATVQVVPLPAGESACLRGATLVPDGEVALVRVGTEGRPAVPLTASVAAPGYRDQASIPATWKDNDLLAFAFDPPDRAVSGRFCLRNDGRRTVFVYGAGDSLTSAQTVVGGERAPTNIQLTFRTAEPRSVLDRAGDIAGAITRFRPGIVGTAVVWVLLVVTFLALTAGAAWALWRALGEDGPRGAEPSAAGDAHGDEPQAARRAAPAAAGRAEP